MWSLFQLKREVPQHIASIYVPMGYFSPTILKAKLLMKKLYMWINKCDWDDKIRSKCLMEWKDISEQLSSYNLPRYIGITEKSKAIHAVLSSVLL